MPGAAQMAPTAKLQKHKHEMDLARLKIACQEDLIKELTKERDFLKEQLSQGKSVIYGFSPIHWGVMLIYFVTQMFICFIDFS